jgi:hypothetical protein
MSSKHSSLPGEIEPGPGELAFPVERVLVDPTKAPRAAHHFMLARRGIEITLEVGHIDLQEFHSATTEAIASGQAKPVTVFVTDRFAVSPLALEQLKTALDDFLKPLSPHRKEAIGDAPATHT